VFHVVTVHWKLDTWIEPQLRYFRRFLPADTRVYASLNGIDGQYGDAFAYAADLPGTHPEKLNALAEIVSAGAAPDDYIVFIDGDAFPIAPLRADVLRGTPLAAVRRDENLNDPQPHPCFCITTVGFWNEIRGDWRPGYTWTNALGYRTSDVGANLLGILRERNIEWRPLLRTNEVDLHHLWFAIYDDVVYHHGAGFRGRRARATLDLRRALTPSWVPILRRVDRNLALNAAVKRRRAGGQELLAREQAISDALVAAIKCDEPFVQEYLSVHDIENEPLEES
jgi:hypothetical protein